MTLKLKSNSKGKLSAEQVKALFLKGSAKCRCPFKKRCSESLQGKGRLFERNEKGLHSFKGIPPPHVSLPAAAVAEFANLLGASTKRPQSSR